MECERDANLQPPDEEIPGRATAKRAAHVPYGTGTSDRIIRIRLMKRQNTIFAFALFVVVALLLGGCASSYQARGMEMKETMFVNPAILTPGKGDQALY